MKNDLHGTMTILAVMCVGEGWTLVFLLNKNES